MDSTSQLLSANNCVSNLELQDVEPTLEGNLESLDISQLRLSDKTIDLKKDEDKKQPSQVEEKKELPKMMNPDFKEDEDKKQPSHAEKLSSSEKEELAKTIDEQMSSKRTQTLEESSQMEEETYQICKYGSNNWTTLPLKEELYRLQLCEIYEEDVESEVYIILNYEVKFHLLLKESFCIPSIPGKYVAVFSSHKRYVYPRQVCADLQALDGHSFNVLSVFKTELDVILTRETCSLNDLKRLIYTDEFRKRLSEEEIMLIEDYMQIESTVKDNLIKKIHAKLDKLSSLLSPERDVNDFLEERDFDALGLWATEQSDEIQKAVGEYLEVYNELMK